MKPYFLISALFIAAVFTSCADKTDETILQLDEAMSKKAFYEQNLLDRVSVLRSILDGARDPAQAYDIRKRIAEEFFSYSMDSTIATLQTNRALAYEMGDKYRMVETSIMMAEEYTMAGYYLEAKALLDAIDRKELSGELIKDYYAARHSLAGESLAYTSDRYMKADLEDEREYYRNLLLDILDPESSDYHYMKMEESALAGDSATALEHARALVDLAAEYSHDYAIGAYFCYEYTDSSDSEARKQWLARSSTADVMCATRDYASLNTLSALLFSEGDLDRAFRYAADHCMSDAIAFGGKLRPWQVAKFFSRIEMAYQERTARQQRVQLWMIFILSGLVIAVGLLFILLFQRQKVLDETRLKLSESYVKLENQNNNLVTVNQRVMALNKELAEADKLKESFIALFLGILSENIDANRQYKNRVLRNIRRGKAADVAAEIEDLPPIDEDIAEFYKMFDRTFIDLYPNFVEKFNSLLQDGEAITPKGDDLLTPELRIFALIKMGITDSGKIATLLHYSVNTIYNYRAKIKNKAKGNRDAFEDRVKEL